MPTATRASSRPWQGGLRAALLPALMLLIAAAAVAGPRPPRVAAHASYEASDPPFAAELDASPSAITLTFTQELFRREGANAISLENEAGERIALGETTVSNQDRRIMSAAVPSALPPGRYLVQWINLSAEDGDDDSGGYPFYVGRPPTEEERDLDRAIAENLRIPYPGDELTEPEAETPEPGAAAPPPAPAASPSAGGPGVAPLVLGGLGLVAIGAVLGAWFSTARKGGDPE